MRNSQLVACKHTQENWNSLTWWCLSYKVTTEYWMELVKFGFPNCHCWDLLSYYCTNNHQSYESCVSGFSAAPFSIWRCITTHQQIWKTHMLGRWTFLPPIAVKTAAMSEKDMFWYMFWSLTGWPQLKPSNNKPKIEVAFGQDIRSGSWLHRWIDPRGNAPVCLGPFQRRHTHDHLVY